VAGMKVHYINTFIPTFAAWGNTATYAVWGNTAIWQSKIN